MVIAYHICIGYNSTEVLSMLDIYRFACLFVGRLYHIASHTDPEYHFSEVMEEKRLAILAHLIGMCEFPQNTYYKRCHHGQLRNERLDPGKFMLLALCASAYCQLLGYPIGPKYSHN